MSRISIRCSYILYCMSPYKYLHVDFLRRLIKIDLWLVGLNCWVTLYVLVVECLQNLTQPSPLLEVALECHDIGAGFIQPHFFHRSSC